MHDDLLQEHLPQASHFFHLLIFSAFLVLGHCLRSDNQHENNYPNEKPYNVTVNSPQTSRASATSSTLLSSVDVLGLPALGSMFTITQSTWKQLSQRETVLRFTVNSPQTSRASATSSTLLSSVDVLGLPALGSLSMLTQPSRKRLAQWEMYYNKYYGSLWTHHKFHSKHRGFLWDFCCIKFQS